MCKLLIAVPTFENISPETFKSIYDLTIPAPRDMDISFEFVRGYDCAIARNKIAKMALDGEYDYVLMVDSDIVLPKDTLACLTWWNKDVVLGAYPRKNDPSKSEAFLDLGTNFEDQYRVTVNSMKDCDNYLIKIKGGGLGCALIKTEIFKDIDYPYFKYVIYDAENQFLSEDLYFCVKAKNAGYDIFLDNRVLCGHIAKTVIKGS